MYTSRESAGVLLAFFLLMLVVIAGCGGETTEGQDGGDRAATQGKTAEDAQRRDGGATGQEEGLPSEIKIALGDILLVDVEKRRVVLRPVRGERQAFKVVPGAEVTLDDEPAELADLEQGQQAQIQYVIKKDQEHARAVDAFSANGSN